MKLDNLKYISTSVTRPTKTCVSVVDDKTDSRKTKPTKVA